MEDKCFFPMYGSSYQQMCHNVDREIWSGTSIYRKHMQGPRVPCIACVYWELSSTLYAPSCCIHSRFLRCWTSTLIIAQSLTPSADKYCPSIRTQRVLLLHLEAIYCPQFVFTPPPPHFSVAGMTGRYKRILEFSAQRRHL